MSEVRYNVIAPTGVELAVTGNLGKDPDVRDVSGKRVVKFSLAANAGRKKVNDNYENQTQWITVNIWESSPGADKVFSLLNPEHDWMKLKKGAAFHIEGYVVQQTRVHEGNAYVDYDFREVTKFNKPPMPAKKTDGGDSAASTESLPTGTPDNF